MRSRSKAQKTKTLFVQFLANVRLPASVAFRFIGPTHVAVNVVAYVHMFKAHKFMYSITKVVDRDTTVNANMGKSTMSSGRTTPDDIPFPSLRARLLRYFSNEMTQVVQLRVSNSLCYTLHPITVDCIPIMKGIKSANGRWDSVNMDR